MFQNEAPIDFSIEANRNAFQKALSTLEQKIAAREFAAYPIVGGQRIDGGRLIDSVDPASPSQVIGRVHFADAALAVRAVELLAKAGKRWQSTPYVKRVAIIKNAAAGLRSRRLALTALIIREAGKPWKDADAEVAEAIDFCEYYAEQMIRLGPPQRLMPVPGEDNYYYYRPRGVAAVISPWNFPLAIACGMTVASLICGNPTILKPSEQTSLIAFELAEILFQAGVPEYAFAYLPGVGEEVGAALVEHPSTALICFTGSKSVGIEILKKSSEIAPGQVHLKRTILEMGGKNCIIIDEDADLDEAIKGVVYSAFGYAGQKCSACSRVIAVGDIYEQFLGRLREAVSDLIVGSPSQSATLVGPLIDGESRDRVERVIQEAQRSQTLLYRLPSVPEDGFFVAPAVFRDVDPRHCIWTDEIFGPLLACRREETFEEALTIANESQYALTGGVFSRSPKNIQLAAKEFLVGNLYINRGCTGALVCRHPFGGFKLSGVGSKAGGPDYLLQFLEPASVSENTMRRGFAPDIGG